MLTNKSENQNRTFNLFLRIVGIACTITILAVSAANAQKKQSTRTQLTQQTQQKNVLLILCDDLRRDMLAYNGSVAQTPNIDALQKQSINFRSACTTTGLCSPSRAALFTGRLGHRTGLDDNTQLWHSRLLGLDLKQTTLIEWAKQKGYFVGYFGKWHLGARGPMRRGADRYSEAGGMEDREDFGPKPNFEEVKSYDNKKNVIEKPQYFAVAKGSYNESEPKKEINDGIKFLQKVNNTATPFFLTVSFHAPHPPYKVPRPYDTLYDHTKVVLPASIHDSFYNKPSYQRDVLWPWHYTAHMSKEDWQKTIAYSWASVTLLDRAIGELLDALKKTGKYDNTLIVFASDQGSMLGDHGLYDKAAYSYDELMRIPMLIKVPGIAPKSIERHVSLIDLNQTLVEWMGIQPKQLNIDSRSLFPLIINGDKGWNTPDEAFYLYEWYNGSWFGVRTIRTPNYKYCWNPAGGIDELYDLKKDPHEIQNLVVNPDYKKITKDFQLRLLYHLKKIQDPLYETMKLVKKMK